MKVKFISCQIFEIYINTLIDTIKLDYSYDITYLEIDQHNEPEVLNKILQNEIDNSLGYDLIILLYGICGNSTKGLIARDTRIAIPRVHDCSTILLGGKDTYEKVFGHRPSQGWKCASYNKEDIHSVSLESNPIYMNFVKEYGEDNALYLFETLYPKSDSLVYIDFGLEKDKIQLKELPDINEIISGSYSYLENILHLNFDDILILNSGEMIHPIYDKEVVIDKKS